MRYGWMLGIALLALHAAAQTPREQFGQMVAQLQANPGDHALRERIVRLAQELRPAPAVPKEAERLEGRAQYLFKSAQNKQDYLDAAREYERAVAAAPWVAGYYTDLCTIYEKAERPRDAKRNCELALAGAGNPAEASDLRRRIGGLEITIERADAVQRAEEQKQAEDAGRARFLQALAGTEFVRQSSPHIEGYARVQSGSVEFYHRRRSQGTCLCGQGSERDLSACTGPVGEEMLCGRYTLAGRQTRVKAGPEFGRNDVEIEFDGDSRSMNVTLYYSSGGRGSTFVYRRR